MKSDAKLEPSKLAEQIDANVWNYYALPPEPLAFRAMPDALLSPNRLDVISRYLVVKHFELGWGVGWATNHYRDLLFASNASFIDGDGQKSGFSDYLRNFTSLITDARNGKFDAERVVIPYVGDTIVDGAHRLAVALYFNIPVYFLELAGPRQPMNVRNLQKMGMRIAQTEQLLLEYIRVDKRVYCCIFFSPPAKRLSDGLRALRETADLVLEKTLVLSDAGKLNVMALLYGHEEWWKSDLANPFAELRLPEGRHVTFAFFRPRSTETARTLKERVRQYFTADHFVHGNDTHEESTWIADIVLSPGGRRHLNRALQKNFPTFSKLINQYRIQMSDFPNPDEFAVDSGAVLAAHGIRDCHDLDYVHAGNQNALLFGNKNMDISNHNEEYQDAVSSLTELIANPDHFFRWKGLKFLSLDTVLLLKFIRGSVKDIDDIHAILRNGSEKTNRLGNFAGFIRKKWQKVMARKSQFIAHFIGKSAKVLKQYLPTPAFRLIRAIWRLSLRITERKIQIQRAGND